MSDAAQDGDSLQQAVQTLSACDRYRLLKRISFEDFVGTLRDDPEADATRIGVIDCETTGLDAEQDGVIELALDIWDVDGRTGLPLAHVASFEGFNDPGIAITPEAERATGITQAMVQGKSIDSEAVQEVCEDVQLFVAHNAAFDRAFVEPVLPWMRDRAWVCSYSDIDWPLLGCGSRSLEALCMRQGGFYDAHRARADVIALSWLLLTPTALAAQATGLEQSSTLMHRLLQARGEIEYSVEATGSPFESKDRLRKRRYRWDASPNQRVWRLTGIRSRDALVAELAWLREHVYEDFHPKHCIAIYRRNALQRFTQDLGARSMIPIGWKPQDASEPQGASEPQARQAGWA